MDSLTTLVKALVVQLLVGSFISESDDATQIRMADTHEKTAGVKSGTSQLQAFKPKDHYGAHKTPVLFGKNQAPVRIPVPQYY